MQTITIESVEAKTFDRKDGSGTKGTFYILKDTDGNEFTSFDTKLKDMKGAVLEIEVKISRGKVNIEKWVVKEPPKSSAPGPDAGKSLDQIMVELQSLEARVAYNGVIELIKTGKVEFDGVEAKLASRWAAAKMEASLPSPGAKPAPAKEAVKSPPPTAAAPVPGPKYNRDPVTILIINDLYKACHEDWGMQPEAVLKELGYTDKNDIIETPADCYRRIAAVKTPPAEVN